MAGELSFPVKGEDFDFALEQNSLQCPTCSIKFTDKETLTEHLSGCLEIQSPTEQSSQFSTWEEQVKDVSDFYVVIDNPYLFKCEVCKKVLRRKSTLQEHMSIHTGEKRFACEICFKKFTRKPQLKAHMPYHNIYEDASLLLNLSEGNFCAVCMKTFSSADELSNHKLIHTMEKAFACDICSKRFNYKESVKNHIYSHLRFYPHRCKLCRKKFITKFELTQHTRSHMKSFARKVNVKH